MTQSSMFFVDDTYRYIDDLLLNMQLDSQDNFPSVPYDITPSFQACSHQPPFFAGSSSRGDNVDNETHSPEFHTMQRTDSPVGQCDTVS